MAGRAGPWEVDGAIPCGDVIQWIAVTLGIDTGAYQAADNIGGKLTFANAARETGGCGRIQTVVVVDQDNEKTEKDIFFFHTDPSNSTITNNAALDIADADLLTCVGYVNVPAAAYKSLNDNAVAIVSNVGIVFDLPSGATSLYAAVVERGTPTYTAVTDLQISIGIIQA